MHVYYGSPIGLKKQFFNITINFLHLSPCHKLEFINIKLLYNATMSL